MLRLIAVTTLISALNLGFMPASAEVRISRGTTICILEPSELNSGDAGTVRCKATAYLPPGTIVDRVESRRAPGTVLLKTRFGLAGRQTPSSKFWTEPDFVEFKEAGTVAFITRDAAVSQVTGFDGTPCKLTRGEWYRVDRTADSDQSDVALTITSRKTQCLKPGTSATATLPRRSAVLVQFTGNSVEQLDEDDAPIRVAAYQPHEFRNALDFTKECGVEIDDSGNVSGSIKLDLGELVSSFIKSLPVGLAAKAEKQISFKKHSPKERQETAQFFKGTEWIIQIGVRKECEKLPSGAFRVPTARWYYVVAGDQNADLDIRWLTELQLRANPQTKSAKISCAREYFAVADALKGAEFPREAIPFLISRIAQIDDFGNDSSCGR